MAKKKNEEKGPLTVVLMKSVKTEITTKKIAIVGALDPSKVQQKTKKQVDLISPQVKKDKKNDPKPKPKPDNKPKEEKPKEPPVTTAVLKVALDCQGCIDKIHKIVSKFKGVKDMSVDRQKDLVTVTGTMDVKALAKCLEEKVKRSVKIVQLKKEKDEKESNGGGGSGGKKKSNGGGGDGVMICAHYVQGVYASKWFHAGPGIVRRGKN